MILSGEQIQIENDLPVSPDWGLEAGRWRFAQTMTNLLQFYTCGPSSFMYTLSYISCFFASCGLENLSVFEGMVISNVINNFSLMASVCPSIHSHFRFGSWKKKVRLIVILEFVFQKPCVWWGIFSWLWKYSREAPPSLKKQQIQLSESDKKNMYNDHILS